MWDITKWMLIATVYIIPCGFASQYIISNTFIPMWLGILAVAWCVILNASFCLFLYYKLFGVKNGSKTNS